MQNAECRVQSAECRIKGKSVAECNTFLFNYITGVIKNLTLV